MANNRGYIDSGMGGDMEVPIPQKPPMDMTENPDGSVTINQPEVPLQADFYTNLLNVLDIDADRIASTYLELIDKDKEARSPRDRLYAEGLKKTGMSDQKEGGADFEGASDVVHPTLVEACVDFSARAAKELLPPNGPVKTHFKRDVNDDERKQAQARADYLNELCTERLEGFGDTIEQTLTQVPLGGSEYINLFWDHEAGTPDIEFVGCDDVFLPYSATSLLNAQRYTHRIYLTREQFTQRIQSGEYVSPTGIVDPGLPEFSESRMATDSIEGKEDTGYNEDGLRTLYRINCRHDFGEGYLPYMITIDEHSRSLVCIYRNWDSEDPRRQRMHWLVEFGFIPWRGAYKIGLIHLIGNLSDAATGALRALLDSAHINNAPSALKLKSAIGGQSPEVRIGNVTEIEGPANIDDVRKLAMPLPFNPPSPVLFELLGWLTDAAKGVVTTAEEKIADASNQMPVGTAQALIEQGAVVYSSIHARLHRSMARMFRVMMRLIRIYGNPEEQALFSRDIGVSPVSDPAIFSETQRYSQAQALEALSQGHPELYDAYAIQKRLLETMKVPDIDDVLNPQPKAEPSVFLQENVNAMLGIPVQVGADQSHIAHLIGHVDFLRTIMVSDSTCAKALPILLPHITEHLGFWYADVAKQTIAQAAGEAFDPNIFAAPEILAQYSKEIDETCAAASGQVMGLIQSQIQQMLPVITQAEQKLEDLMTRMLPPDQRKLIEDSKASRMAMENQAMETSRRAEIDKMKAIQDSQRMVLEYIDKERTREAQAQIEAAKLSMDAGILQDQVLVPLSTPLSADATTGTQMTLIMQGIVENLITMQNAPDIGKVDLVGEFAKLRDSIAGIRLAPVVVPPPVVTLNTPQSETKRPKSRSKVHEIERDENGDIVRVKTIDQVHEVGRDDNGNITRLGSIS